VSGVLNTNSSGIYALTYTTTNYLGMVNTINRTVVVVASPFATTLPATGIFGNIAYLNGIVAPNGSPAAGLFQWGDHAAYSNTSFAISCGNGFGTVPVTIGTS